MIILKTSVSWFKSCQFVSPKLSPLGRGLGYFSPESLFTDLNIDFSTVTLISSGFAARNIAIGVLALYALISRNLFAYQALFISRFFVDFQDMINAIIAYNNGQSTISIPMAVGSLTIMFLLPLFLGNWQIAKEIKKASA